ncbi:MAG: lipid-A-disaccharide synthase N-terminal domain-containing protein [Planctomycetota bacterium]|nr:lipid-A-disaccharide synthase N-terminal domain-containing protein [Planctomycetota bacterium]MDA1113472.1 lipid-A-disaccharide synthase N-terminal domain-containing protein [Planctomycetota bacterium]
MNWWEQFSENAKSPIAIVGFIGQAIFFMRFLVQWLASEKEQKSVIPTAFWYFSIGGAFLLLLYGILDHDPVILIGQSTGLLIYLRNLHFIRIQKREKSLNS